ncbi:MAG: hypothetical protein ACXVX4_09375 [Mycobacterium sp.]
MRQEVVLPQERAHILAEQLQLIQRALVVVVKRWAFAVPEPIPSWSDPLGERVVALVGQVVVHQALDLGFKVDRRGIELGHGLVHDVRVGNAGHNDPLRK